MDRDHPDGDERKAWSTRRPAQAERGHADPADRWIAGPHVLAEPLPADVRSGLGRLVGEESVDTLGDWADVVRRRTGGSIAVDDLCHASDATGHRGVVDGETYHFACFFDAVILSALVAEPVEIRTESPGGAVIEARAAGTEDLSVRPRDAVFSFGIAEALASPPGEPTHEDVYAAICPFVRAFPHVDAYRRWTGDVRAATVAMPLADATAVAEALVE